MTQQTITEISIGDLLNKVRAFKYEGWRLVQICCTKLPDVLELQYSFDKDYVFNSLKIVLKDTSTAVPSVSGIYLSAFLYENEIHDLFGINVQGIAVDYKGEFYRTQVKHGFNQEVQPAGEKSNE
ncbi:MAG: NADH-quinone oxidoreductase subunit C [Candidatus Omnitrophica bacterium]|nr:NADH-quinone oxidoreductase subunit C [Candidatus Omnitrophota bacterium]